jgi:hypothetical protein
MYKDRRRRQSAPEEYVDQQLDTWRWDSHLWADKDMGGGVSQRHCEWCGWVPPTEMPLDHATLCQNNPVIMARDKAVADKINEAIEVARTGKKEDNDGRG